MAVRVVTDSTSYLPDDAVERYKIRIVPLSVTLDGVTYVEGVADAAFYQALRARRGSRQARSRRLRRSRTRSERSWREETTWSPCSFRRT